jgi:integrase
MATARKLPSGSYRVNQYVGKDDAGKRIYKSFTGDTKREAELAAAEYVAGKRTHKPQEMTLKEAYSGYIKSKEHVLSPSTVLEYKRAANRDLQVLMPLKLSEITQERVQSAINIEAAAHSPKSVRNAHGLLSAVLAMYAPDISLHTTLPQRRKQELYVPSNDDIKVLMSKIAGTELEKAVMLAAFGSLRRSEISALMSDDIHGNTITVSKAMVQSEDKTWVIKQPKTVSGNRTLELPQFVIDRISGGDGRVCNLAPGTITNRFAIELNRCGLPHFRFHDLRHYQASILHAMGVPDKYIIQRGGWKTDSTLKNIYQHTMDEKRQEVEQQICGYFENMQHEMQHGAQK